MGMVMVENFDEFASSEMDIHISNSSEDTQLYNEIKQLSQAAIQNGQAKIEDLIAVAQSESVQETGRKLAESAEKIKREQDEREQANRESQEKMSAMQAETAQKIIDNDNMNKEADRAVKYAEIEADKWKVLVEQDGKMTIEGGRIDSDSNGIDDRLDLERTENDKNYKEGTLALNKENLNEKIRANKANEEIKKAGNKKKESSAN